MSIEKSGWLSDNTGRISNISLAPNAKNALYPLFEAIMNSIHAIEERFGRDNLSKGKINIEIHSNDDQSYCGFTVHDNGAGFNEDNLLSLRKFDSRKKSKIGGKGVGRLLWLKVADAAHIVSSYANGDQVTGSNFTFTIENPVSDYRAYKKTDGIINTSVTISPFNSEFLSRLPRKLDTIANRIISHFISYFANIEHPEITLTDISAIIYFT